MDVNREIYTVSELNTAARHVLEDAFGTVWLEGEISNLARPRSGHVYFSLKDDQAQVRCAMFRNRLRGIDFKPEDGQQVLARAQVSLYRERGEFQLIVEYLEQAGAGALRRAFELLKQRLQKEGLFAAERKQPLPDIPTRIGVITSPTGAAVQDVVRVIGRRFPSMPIIVYPTRVQGEGAGAEIARMIEHADRHQLCDVLLLVRGGGSIEDLWAFNEEVTARAIAACAIPVVAGVGHESDVTIADFVADLRAPTPSAAAELVTPDRLELLNRLAEVRSRLITTIGRVVDHRIQTLGLVARQLRHPSDRLNALTQRADELSLRIDRAISERLNRYRSSGEQMSIRLKAANPKRALGIHTKDITALSERLARAGAACIDRTHARFTTIERELAAVSPQRTLERGYAVVIHGDGKSGDIVRHSTDAEVGSRIVAKLATGEISATVEALDHDARLIGDS